MQIAAPEAHSLRNQSPISKQYSLAARVIKVIQNFRELTATQLQIKTGMSVRDYYLYKNFIQEIGQNEIEYDKINKVWKALDDIKLPTSEAEDLKWKVGKFFQN